VEITGERTRKEENKEWRGEKEVEERPEQRRREKRGLFESVGSIPTECIFESATKKVLLGFIE
jgi:hypothetical protein